MTPVSLDPQDRSRLTRGAAIASMSVALLLVMLKGWAVWRTGSTAMLGSLADTTLDLIASLATLIGVWIAAQPADEEHRFGHGKAEALAAIVQVTLISLSAFGIGFQAVQNLLAGNDTYAANDGIAVSVIAIAATFALLAWQRHVIRKTGSVAIRTDNVHYKSDLALNLAVIAALVLDQYLGLPDLGQPVVGDRRQGGVAVVDGHGVVGGEVCELEPAAVRAADDHARARDVEARVRHRGAELHPRARALRDVEGDRGRRVGGGGDDQRGRGGREGEAEVHSEIPFWFMGVARYERGPRLLSRTCVESL